MVSWAKVPTITNNTASSGASQQALEGLRWIFSSQFWHADFPRRAFTWTWWADSRAERRRLIFMQDDDLGTSKHVHVCHLLLVPSGLVTWLVHSASQVIFSRIGERLVSLRITVAYSHIPAYWFYYWWLQLEVTFHWYWMSSDLVSLANSQKSKQDSCQKFYQSKKPFSLERFSGALSLAYFECPLG